MVFVFASLAAHTAMAIVLNLTVFIIYILHAFEIIHLIPLRYLAHSLQVPGCVCMGVQKAKSELEIEKVERAKMVENGRTKKNINKYQQQNE